jgi:predicted RNA-binding protein with PUA-like domain
MTYWLMKSEPDVFSIDHLARRPRRRAPWDGVRNYQARNYLRAMAKDDLAFFYHSSCPAPGIQGVVRIVRTAYPDPSQFDSESEYFDPKSDPADPRWSMVDVALERRFDHPVALDDIKRMPQCSGMQILRRGNRLSITPVTAIEWRALMTRGGHPTST